jgi:hypothetical protein
MLAAEVAAASLAGNGSASAPALETIDSQTAITRSSSSSNSGSDSSSNSGGDSRSPGQGSGLAGTSYVGDSGSSKAASSVKNGISNKAVSAGGLLDGVPGEPRQSIHAAETFMLCDVCHQQRSLADMLHVNNCLLSAAPLQ